MTGDVQRRMAEGPFTALQVVAVGVCVCLNMLDGFDILAMSFAASGVKSAWHLDDSHLGYLLSAGLVGMAIGSLAIAPWADRIGRRPVVLLSVTIAGVGMIASAAAAGFPQLMVLRICTGVGIGGTIASAAVIASEYAPQRWRSVALAVYATGYSIGATVGGLLTALAIRHSGWRSAFVIGGALSLALVPVAWRLLPESIDFLLVRRPPNALRRINGLLMGMRHAPLRVLPEHSDPDHQSRGVLALLRASTTRVAMFAWVMFFCAMAGWYFIASWTPRLLTAAGLSASQGLSAGILLNLGGIAGCGLYAWGASLVNARSLLAGALIATAFLIATFGFSLGNLSAALGIAVLLGVIANSVMAGLYAVGPGLYPTPVRATGMGAAIGIGRIGAILAPTVSGALLDAGWTPRGLYLGFSAPYFVAALALWRIGLRSEKE